MENSDLTTNANWEDDWCVIVYTMSALALILGMPFLTYREIVN